MSRRQTLPIDQVEIVSIQYFSAVASFDYIKVWDKTSNVVFNVYPEGETALVPMAHEINLIVKVRNIGGEAAYIVARVYDDDTNEWLDTVESTPYVVPPNEVFEDYLVPGSMPMRNWNLRVEAGHFF